MSLTLYIDDCACAKTLVELLRRAGHKVTIPSDAGVAGLADEIHFRWAADHFHTLLTKNPDDFARLHEQNQQHSGILVIYQDNNPERDMNYGEIVRAISNLTSSGVKIHNTLHVLNAWRS